MSGEEFVSVSRLVEYMKSLENEMRDIRQRLEQIERGIEMEKYRGVNPSKQMKSELKSSLSPRIS